MFHEHHGQVQGTLGFGGHLECRLDNAMAKKWEKRLSWHVIVMDVMLNMHTSASPGNSGATLQANTNHNTKNNNSNSNINHNTTNQNTNQITNTRNNHATTNHTSTRLEPQAGHMGPDTAQRKILFSDGCVWLLCVGVCGCVCVCVCVPVCVCVSVCGQLPFN